MPQYCLSNWAARLEHEPGLWLLRDLRTDLWWGNLSVRKSFLPELPSGFWPYTIMQKSIYLDDVAKVEDAISKSIKLNAPQRVTFRCKRNSIQVESVCVAIYPAACGYCCGRNCHLLLGYSEKVRN